MRRAYSSAFECNSIADETGMMQRGKEDTGRGNDSVMLCVVRIVKAETPEIARDRQEDYSDVQLCAPKQSFSNVFFSHLILFFSGYINKYS